MNTTHGFTHDKHGFVPVVKTFDELPAKAVLRIYELMRMPMQVVARNILELLLGYAPKKVKLTEADYINILPLIKPVLASRLTKNPLPLIRVGGKKFIGPTDKLANITLYEWILCGQFANEFADGDKEAALKLAAVLWRPQLSFLEGLLSKTEESRIALTDSGMMIYRANFKALPEHWLTAMMMFFIGSREVIFEENPSIFVKKTDSKATDYDLTDLIADMAKEYGKSPKEISCWSFDEVLFHLSKQLRKNARST